MNYTSSVPNPASESAPLPRYELDQDPNGRDPTWDPSDVVATLERPPVTRSTARRILRKATLPPLLPAVPVLEVEEEEEIAPEDILLEAYPEPQPSAPRASAIVKRAEPRSSSAVRAVAPPTGASNVARIDELLRSELPAEPAPPPPPLFQETPSIAPVAFTPDVEVPRSYAPPPVAIAIAQPAPMQPVPQKGSGKIWGVALLAAGLAAGLTFVLMAPSSSFNGVRAFGSSIVTRAKARASSPQPAAPVSDARPAVATSSPQPAAAAPTTTMITTATPVSALPSASPTTVSVDALPKVEIEPGKTLVTFPSSADGHRIFVDSQALATGTAPAKLKCGTHNIRIGSAGKVRKVDLPCGRAFELK